MSKISKRGYHESDIRWFSEKELVRLKKAKEEIEWLIDREYKIESVVTFVGDRYQFSIRQRDALKRATCTTKQKELRMSKRLSCDEIKNDGIYIDGFNLIITLEVALSGGTLIQGRDGNIRDLAGLRGTYKIIDKTDIAIKIIADYLEKQQAEHVKIYLDAPVSNSGNLKCNILEIMENYNFITEVELVNNADIVLDKLGRIVSSDAAIIDKCSGYFNLCKSIIEDYIPEAKIININL